MPSFRVVKLLTRQIFDTPNCQIFDTRIVARIMPKMKKRKNKLGIYSCIDFGMDFAIARLMPIIQLITDTISVFKKSIIELKQ